jgi:hypothetical protein
VHISIGSVLLLVVVLVVVLLVLVVLVLVLVLVLSSSTARFTSCTPASVPSAITFPSSSIVTSYVWLSLLHSSA